MFFSQKIQKGIKLLPINFSKPWWQLITAQKNLFIIISMISILARIFRSISPFLIAKAFEMDTLAACITLFVIWLIIDCLDAYARTLNITFQLQCIHSIYHSAHQHLLTIDPRYHVHRSSGTVLGKIERSARGYEDILDQITFEFIPLSVGVITMFITISQFSLLLAISITAIFGLMVCMGYYFSRYACKPWEQNFIATDDAFKHVAVENLAQVQLVRSVFASDYINRKLYDVIEINMHSESRLWFSYTLTTFVLNMCYLGTIFGLIGVLAWQIHGGHTSILSAIGLTLAYITSTKELVTITRPLRRYMRGWTAVTDLFEFIRTFGKQSFPVLGKKIEHMVKADAITIQAQAISFDYEHAKLFNNHSLFLTCTHKQENKLFGIIGPSGSGKSTLLSILGGQLKPITGTVLINDIDLYTVTDATRRELIALQGQVATSVQGTVKYNLTFGLPTGTVYEDSYLHQILERVGLSSILPDGLMTTLGEGGLNLSGGQRQRLNFASLYLRAHYYKPVLLLIDEPTSSLDEISEAAITNMILELAHSAVTLVIAHRLKTVERAAGLIDLSLLQDEKDILAYTASELEKRSLYYRQLVQGKIRIDI